MPADEFFGGPPAVTANTIPILQGEDLAKALPRIDYLVPGLALVGGGGAPDLIAGYGFSGKTIAAQSLALSLAAGRAVWGVHHCSPVRVLHVDLEQGHRLTVRRYQRLASAMGLDLGELGDSIAVVIMPDLRLVPEHRDQWLALMKGRQLMIVDSLRVAVAGADENSSDIRAGLDMLGSVSDATGCRALVIHHARKDSEHSSGGAQSIRGSGAIYDAVDSAWIFSAAKGEPVRVSHVKARTHGELLEDLALVVSDVEVDGDLRGGLAVKLHGSELLDERADAARAARASGQTAKDVAKLRARLARGDGPGVRQLRAELQLSGDRMGAAMESMGAAMEIREHKEGRGVTQRHYLRGAP